MKLAVIAGDGIGPEVIDEALKVLDVVLPGVEKTEYDLGARRYHATGELLPDRCHRRTARPRRNPAGRHRRPVGAQRRARARAAAQDSASRWTTTSTCGRRGCIPGVSSPLAGDPNIDFVVVREGTEGPYTGNGGAIRVGTPHEVATEVSVNTAFGVRAGGARRVRPGAGRAAST